MKKPTQVFSFKDVPPNQPIPGDRLDAQFQDHAAAINDTQTALNEVRRSDGALKNGIVTKDSLAPGLLNSLILPVIPDLAPSVAAAQSAAVDAQLASQAAKTHADDAQKAEHDAEGAASAAESAKLTALAAANSARISAAEADNYQQDTENAANHALYSENKAHMSAEMAMAWAEHLPDTIPPKYFPDNAITGDHWSARWWANRAAGAAGFLTSMYLGAHSNDAAALASATPPLMPGVLYYNTTTNMLRVWDGVQFQNFSKPIYAATSTLVYAAASNQQVFSLATADIYGQLYTLDPNDVEGVVAYVNGVRLTQQPGSLAAGDFVVNAAANTVTIAAPLPAGAVVQFDILVPRAKLQPGVMFSWLLRDIDYAPTTLAPGQKDGVRTEFQLFRADTGAAIAAANAAELQVSVDGIIQEPGVDYRTNVDRIVFTDAPRADSKVFIIWHQPGASPGAAPIRIPASTRLDALMDVTATGSAAPRGGQTLVFDAAASVWKPSDMATSLAKLGDVAASGLKAPKANEVLTWNATTAKWEPKAGSTSMGLVDLSDVDAKNTHVPQDKDVLMYDKAAKMWSPAPNTPQVAVKVLSADADPDPSKLPAGYLVATTENNKHRISVVTATGTLVPLFDDTDLNQRIAANSLFQGAVKTAGELTGLPTPANGNRGFYWTWQGASNFALTGSGVTGSIKDPTTGLATAVLNPGDWLQSDGAKWLHVSSDLLSKARWQNLGGFTTFAAGSYEVGSIVIHRASASSPVHYYRATAAVSPTDPAPGRAGAPWEDITPQSSIKGASDYDNSITPLPGDVIGWDGTKFGIVTPKENLTEFRDVDPAIAPNANDALVWDGVQWVALSLAIQNLADVTITSPPTDGEVLVWDAATSAWVPRVPTGSAIRTASDYDNTTAPTDGQAVVWNAALNKFAPGSGGMFLGSLANRPTGTPQAGQTYYQTAAETITTTTPTTTPVGIIDPAPTFDPRMLTPLAAGAVPDPVDPSQPWRSPTVVALPSVEPKYRVLFNGVTYQVNAANTLIARIAAGETTPAQWAAGTNPPVSASVATPGSTTSVSINPGFYRYDGARWHLVNQGSYIPLFTGTFSVGSKTGNTYNPPTTPAEGDIWVDKNPATPVFKVYRGGAWVQVNWQTDHLGLLSDLANVDVGRTGSPGQGDALIFNQLSETWVSGAVPAHLVEYDRATNYSAGTTVYYKGGLFEAKTRTSGVSPDFQYGDVWFFHRANFAGTGDYVGPISFEAVNIVADATVAPTQTYAPDDLRPHWTLQYTDDTHWAIWQWDLSMAGWTPGSPVPVAQWHRYDTKFTRPTARRMWRNYSAPTNHVGDCVVWIYDDPKGNNAPHYRDFPWTLRPIRSDLISMHDVKAENPADQSILIWNDSTSYWEAKPNPSYTKAETYSKPEVDTKLSALITGFEHGASVIARVNDPPAAPVVDEVYIVNTVPTGAWVGHAKEIALWDGAAWKFTTPQANEAHLVEAEDAIYHWNATTSTWNKIANASSSSTASTGVGEIIAWPLDTWDADTYLECKGQILAVATYGDLYAVIGNKYNTGTAADGTSTFALPDLRGYFLRGVGANGGEGAAGIKQDDTTRLPRTAAFTGTTNNPGDHSHGHGSGSEMRSDGGPNWASGHAVGTTDPAGGHTHTVTISGGGDPQTRPISFSVHWLIRIKAINGGARGPAGAAGTKGTDGDGWTIGDIKQSILTETQFKAQFSTTEAAKWVLADGRNVAGTAYATLTGSATVPDLRGGYLRMAGQNSTNTAWNGGTLNSYQEDTTRAPRNTAFTADSNGGHRHSAGIPSWSTDDFAHYGINDTGVSKKISNVDGWSSQTPYTDYAAAHTHSVSGGDTETRPKSYTVNYFIKVN